MTEIFCGKLLRCPADCLARTLARRQILVFPASSRQAASRHDGVAATDLRGAREERKPQKMRPKRKTRPGGQPDGSSYTGAWGGWALAPNTASMGRDYRSHRHRSREGRRTFKRPANFFNFWATIFGRYQAEIIARRGDGLRERPTCQTPWRHPAGSSPWSRERPDELRLLQRQGCPKPRQPAPAAR